MIRAKLVFNTLVIAFFLSTNAMAADIHKAARKGDLEYVRTLIASGADLSELDKAVGAALHWAAARGHLDVAHELIEAGADPNQEAHAPDLLTPLHLAASSGHLSVVKLLVEAGADIQAGEGAVGTPVHSAAKADRTDVVVFLLNTGADPAAKTSGGAYGIYPLHFAAEAGAVGSITVLLERGFPVNAKNEATGVTALHLAVFQGQLEATSVLMAAGANPHAVSTNIETPVALAKHHPEIEELFIAAGIE